jgi:Na+-driven multidrug efflux pump
VFQSLGKAKQTLILSIARQGIALIPLLILFNFLIGQDGIILAQPVADIVSMLISVALFLPVRRELSDTYSRK